MSDFRPVTCSYRAIENPQLTPTYLRSASEIRVPRPGLGPEARSNVPPMSMVNIRVQ